MSNAQNTEVCLVLEKCNINNNMIKIHSSLTKFLGTSKLNFPQIPTSHFS